MSEDRYALKQRGGVDYWGKSGWRFGMRPPPEERFTRAEALREKAEFLETPSGTDVVIVRLGPRKPKAPREVFCAVTPDGRHVGFASPEHHKVDRAKSGMARVVRYVLAEGET